MQTLQSVVAKVLSCEKLKQFVQKKVNYKNAVHTVKKKLQRKTLRLIFKILINK